MMVKLEAKNRVHHFRNVISSFTQIDVASYKSNQHTITITIWIRRRKIKMVSVQVTILLLVSCLITQSACFEMHYKACNVEDLARHVKAACMRWHRDSKADLSLGPHGSLSPYDNNKETFQLSEGALMAIVQASKPHCCGKRQQKLWLAKRDTSSAELGDRKCCHQICSIDASDLAPHCASN